MERPAKVISRERLEGLLRPKVPVSRIATALQVSRQTAYKAMTEYNLKESHYSNLYNNQINAGALIGQSAMVYCASKPMEKSRVLRIII